MNKKIIWIVIAIVVVIVIIVAVKSPRSATNNSFAVGAVLPLTGPAALWGETVKNGMELAL